MPVGTTHVETLRHATQQDAAAEVDLGRKQAQEHGPDRVIVFNDHPVFRSSLAWKMESGSGVRVIADAPSLYETLALAADLSPDAVLADMRIGDGNSEGIESVAILRGKLGGIPIIVNSDFCSRSHLARMTEAGAAGRYRVGAR